jgi:hypothetical protein
MTNVAASSAPPIAAAPVAAPEIRIAPMKSSVARRATGASGPVAHEKAQDSVPPPEVAQANWLKRIEKLRVEGKTAAADQEFKRFRDAYPDYRPPERPPPADGPTK